MTIHWERRDETYYHQFGQVRLSGCRECPFLPDDSAQATKPGDVQAIYTGAGRAVRVGVEAYVTANAHVPPQSGLLNCHFRRAPSIPLSQRGNCCARALAGRTP